MTIPDIERLEALAEKLRDADPADYSTEKAWDAYRLATEPDTLIPLLALARRGLASPRGEAVAIGQNVTWLSRIGKLWAGTVEAVTYKLRLEDGCTVEGADRDDFRLADPVLSAASPSAADDKPWERFDDDLVASPVTDPEVLRQIGEALKPSPSAGVVVTDGMVEAATAAFVKPSYFGDSLSGHLRIAIEAALAAAPLGDAAPISDDTDVGILTTAVCDARNKWREGMDIDRLIASEILLRCSGLLFRYTKAGGCGKT